MTIAKPGRYRLAALAAGLALTWMGGVAAADQGSTHTVKVDTSAGLDRLGDIGLDANKLDLRKRRLHKSAAPVFEEVMKFEKQRLRPAQVAKVVRKHTARLQYCYARATAATKAPTGVATVHFVVEPKGSVSSVSVVAAGVSGKRLERCMTRAISRWRFPRADAETVVDYPLVFDVAGAPATAAKPK